MEAKELRIGNWVYQTIDKKNITIEVFDIRNIIDGWKSYEPIPLTEERLLKLGNAEKKRFPDEVDVYDRFRFIWKDAYKYWYVVTIKSKEYLTKIEFVHEYQNFIFALTGEELTM